MQVSVETTTGLERQITVTLPAKRIDSAVDQKVLQTAKTIRIDGFRKGKVPISLVQKRYGISIRQEVVGELIQSSYFDAIAEADINPAGMPSIEPQKSIAKQDFIYTAVVEVYPEIILKDPAELFIERHSGTVRDTDVDNMIALLQKQQISWQPVDRASVESDQVNIDFTGYIDSEVFPGGTAQEYDLILGENTMIPGFEAGIIGMKAEAEKDITVIFPKDYNTQSLQGKEALFKIRVNKVSEANLPELNDEFFALYNPKEAGIAGFRKEIQKNMTNEMNQAIKNKLKNKILDAYLALSQFDVPQALIKDEIQRMKQEYKEQLSGSDTQLNQAMLPDEMFTKQATHHVKLRLLVAEIIKVNKLEATMHKVKSLVTDLAQGYDKPQELIDYYMNNKKKLSQIENLVLEDQVVDHLLAAASITEVEIDYETAVTRVRNTAVNQSVEGT